MQSEDTMLGTRAETAVQSTSAGTYQVSGSSRWAWGWNPSCSEVEAVRA